MSQMGISSPGETIAGTTQTSGATTSEVAAKMNEMAQWGKQREHSLGCKKFGRMPRRVRIAEGGKGVIVIDGYRRHVVVCNAHFASTSNTHITACLLHSDILITRALAYRTSIQHTPARILSSRGKMIEMSDTTHSRLCMLVQLRDVTDGAQRGHWVNKLRNVANRAEP
ncbi:hypothetical protein BD779DRAFT_1466434 [Infundibulicybe gibba]|nr:hypothetical protein BD779DRAFT_1466434 [Infundibulicybe gibba]